MKGDALKLLKAYRNAYNDPAASYHNKANIAIQFFEKKTSGEPAAIDQIIKELESEQNVNGQSGQV